MWGAPASLKYRVRRVPFPYALSSTGLNVLAGVFALGLVIGVIGHVIRSRVLIVTGILVIGAASVYFGVFVARIR
jgi:hypothetical protein